MKDVKVNFTEEIALELSKKYGFSKTMCVRNVEYIHKRIRELMFDKETIQFDFGALGVVVASSQMLRRFNKKHKTLRNKDVRKYKLEKIQRLREEGVINKKMYRRMWRRSRINMEYHNGGMSLEELENYQNDYCERRK